MMPFEQTNGDFYFKKLLLGKKEVPDPVKQVPVPI